MSNALTAGGNALGSLGTSALKAAGAVYDTVKGWLSSDGTPLTPEQISQYSTLDTANSAINQLEPYGGLPTNTDVSTITDWYDLFG